MSVLHLAPSCLRSVEAARHSLQYGDWSLETIADDIEAEIAWTSAPRNIVGLISVERGRSVVTIAERMRDSEMVSLLTGRMLAEVIEARALGRAQYVQIVTPDYWRRDRARRAYWSAGGMLAVSLDDVREMVAGTATPCEIGRRRNVPAWIAEARIQAEIAYGFIEGDAVAAVARMVAWSERLLDSLAPGNRTASI